MSKQEMSLDSINLVELMKQAKSDPNVLAKFLITLDKAGISPSDVQKGFQTLRKRGDIKAKGRGKSALSDPLRVEIQAYLTAPGFASTMAKIVEATKDSTSLLVQLTDKYSVNFVKKVKRVKKEKKAVTDEQVVAKENEFAEPAIA